MSLGPLLAGAASGALHAAAEPPLGAWPLSLVCLVPLLHALRGRAPASRALPGFCGGLALGMLAALGPATVGAMRFFAWPWWMGLLAGFGAVCLFAGGSLAVFAVLAGSPGRRTVPWILRVGAALSAAELLRSTALGGFPWLLLSYALAPAPELAQLAAFGGSLAVSFWLGCANATAAAALDPPRRRAAAGAAGVLTLVALAAALSAPPAAGSETWGSVRQAAGPEPPPALLRVLLVQANLPNAWRRDPLRVREALQRQLELSSREAAELVIWPETAIHVLMPANRGLIEQAMRELRAEHLLFGAPRALEARTYNSALLAAGSGEIRGVHDKVRLFPWTERVPWPWARLGLARSSASAGGAPRTLQVKEARLGPLICWEVLFPEIARSHVEAGAGLLVNVSNDGWVLGSGGPEQHLAAATFTAIEFRRPLLRVTTTGISAAIDSAGRIVASIPEDEPGALRVDVRPATGSSVYARWGDLVAWASLGGSLSATLLEAFLLLRRRLPAA